MALILLVLGSALLVEGLALALAPVRIFGLLAWLSGLTVEARRHCGLAGVAAGVGLLWLARRFGAI